MIAHRAALPLAVLTLTLVAVTAATWPARAQEGLDNFAVLYEPGPKWVEGKPVWEQPLQAHGDYMHSLYGQGMLTLGGPFTDSSGGLAILRVKNEEEAREILAADPGLTSGVFTASLRPWFSVDWENYGRPPGEPAPVGPAVGTVILQTSRMDELARFYAEGLGVEPFQRVGEDHRGTRLREVYFGLDRKEESLPPGPVTIWFTVDDLEVTFKRFVALGARVRAEPAEKPWGDRIASVLDLDGNTVGLAQRR